MGDERHRFPRAIIRYAIWLDFRFIRSLRDMHGLLARRGIGVSYETIRAWTINLGRANTNRDAVVWLPEQRVLVAGDVVWRRAHSASAATRLAGSRCPRS